jgi:hypothetical protein
MPVDSMLSFLQVNKCHNNNILHRKPYMNAVHVYPNVAKLVDFHDTFIWSENFKAIHFIDISF